MHSQKINILTVIRNPVGGIRTYIKYTYGALPKNKYHFTLLLAKEKEVDSGFFDEDLRSQGIEIEIYEIQGKRLNFLLFLETFRMLYRRKYGLIHSQGFTAGILSVIANLIWNVPHIITSHDVLREDQFLYFVGKIKKKLLPMILARATVIQSVGNDAQENLEKFLPTLKKKKVELTVIKNGINIENFSLHRHTKDNFLRKKLNLSDNTFLFGFLGRFMPQKGFEYLIEAVNILLQRKNLKYKIKIIAVNEGDYIKKYKKMITAKGLNKYFVFYGFVPDVSNLIIDLDAVVMPSLWEAYSLLPAEALVLGCPVIATNCIGLREVVHNTPALIAESKNSRSLAEKMEEFMNNANQIKQKVYEFVPEAKSRFMIDRTAEQLDQLFERVCKR